MRDLDELERKLKEAHLSDGDPSDEAYEVMSSLIREAKAAWEMRAACQHVLSIAEDRISGTWDDVMLLLRSTLAKYPEAPQ